MMYVVNELDATINVYAYDSATGAIGELLQTVSTVPDPFEGVKSTAEIAIHPSGKFLYNTNRGSGHRHSGRGRDRCLGNQSG